MKIMSTDVIEHVTQEDESTAEVVILSQVEEKEHDKKLMRYDSLDIESANVGRRHHHRGGGTVVRNNIFFFNFALDFGCGVINVVC